MFLKLERSVAGVCASAIVVRLISYSGLVRKLAPSDERGDATAGL